VRAKTKPEAERVSILEFIARVISHIPDKGQVIVRYYGLCKALGFRKDIVNT
jgi:hypothetical protein